MKIIYTVALLLCLISSQSWAWGHQIFLSSKSPRRDAHLIFQVLKKNQINYCINDEHQSDSKFQKDSIELQVKAALSLWLLPISDMFDRQTPVIIHVPCNSESLNLMISFKDLNIPGDSTDGTSIFYPDQLNAARQIKFITVLINVGEPRLGGLQRPRQIDTLKL